MDLVARSGARNSKEFQDQFLAELSDYTDWCSCALGTHYVCPATQDIDGIRHRTYDCGVCARNCILRGQAYSQVFGADQNPPHRERPKEQVPAQTQRDKPFESRPGETDIHHHNSKYTQSQHQADNSWYLLSGVGASSLSFAFLLLWIKCRL